MMDLDHTRINVSFIQELTKLLTQPEREAKASLIATATHCPIIAVYYYIAELYGMTPIIQSRIDNLCNYYNIKEVIGYKPYESRA